VNNDIRMTRLITATADKFFNVSQKLLWKDRIGFWNKAIQYSKIAYNHV
jgi:hypothetical protein